MNFRKYMFLITLAVCSLNGFSTLCYTYLHVVWHQVLLDGEMIVWNTVEVRTFCWASSNPYGNATAIPHSGGGNTITSNSTPEEVEIDGCQYSLDLTNKITNNTSEVEANYLMSNVEVYGDSEWSISISGPPGAPACEYQGFTFQSGSVKVGSYNYDVGNIDPGLNSSTAFANFVLPSMSGFDTKNVRFEILLRSDSGLDLAGRNAISYSVKPLGVTQGNYSIDQTSNELESQRELFNIQNPSSQNLTISENQRTTETFTTGVTVENSSSITQTLGVDSSWLLNFAKTIATSQSQSITSLSTTQITMQHYVPLEYRVIPPYKYLLGISKHYKVDFIGEVIRWNDDLLSGSEVDGTIRFTLHNYSNPISYNFLDLN